MESNKQQYLVFLLVGAVTLALCFAYLILTSMGLQDLNRLALELIPNLIAAGIVFCAVYWFLRRKGIIDHDKVPDIVPDPIPDLDSSADKFIKDVKNASEFIGNALESEGFKPDLGVCCSRSSAVFAGILCERLRIPELQAIPRVVVNDEYQMCPLNAVGEKPLREKKVLIIFYVLDARKLAALRKNLTKVCNLPAENVRVAAFYSPKLEGIGNIINFKIGGSSDRLGQLPWAEGDYRHPKP